MAHHAALRIAEAGFNSSVVEALEHPYQFEFLDGIMGTALGQGGMRQKLESYRRSFEKSGV